MIMTMQSNTVAVKMAKHSVIADQTLKQNVDDVEPAAHSNSTKVHSTDNKLA